MKADNPVQYKAMKFAEYIKRKYGLSMATYEEMCGERNGCCDSCGIVATRLLVDHDHVSGKVRGLLCNRCNVLAGYLEKNPDLLHKAIAYLKAWGVPKAA